MAPTVTSIIRVTDPEIDGFDYELTYDRAGNLIVEHSGKYAGLIGEIGGGYWLVDVPNVFGKIGPLTRLAPARSLEAAVATLDAHWAAVGSEVQ